MPKAEEARLLATDRLGKVALAALPHPPEVGLLAHRPLSLLLLCKEPLLPSEEEDMRLADHRRGRLQIGPDPVARAAACT